MSKKNKRKRQQMKQDSAKIKPIDRMIYGCNLEIYSLDANMHNIRGLQNSLRELEIPYVRLNYVVNGRNIYAFQSIYEHKDIIKKLCAQYKIEFILACIQEKSGRYGVHKENVKYFDKESAEFGEIKTITEAEAKSLKTYFSDDKGHYFIIDTHSKVAA